MDTKIKDLLSDTKAQKDKKAALEIRAAAVGLDANSTEREVRTAERAKGVTHPKSDPNAVEGTYVVETVFERVDTAVTPPTKKDQQTVVISASDDNIAKKEVEATLSESLNPPVTGRTFTRLRLITKLENEQWLENGTVPKF